MFATSEVSSDFSLPCSELFAGMDRLTALLLRELSERKHFLKRFFRCLWIESNCSMSRYNVYMLVETIAIS